MGAYGPAHHEEEECDADDDGEDDAENGAGVEALVFLGVDVAGVEGRGVVDRGVSVVDSAVHEVPKRHAHVGTREIGGRRRLVGRSRGARE